MKFKMLNKILYAMETWLARSSILVWLAIKVRNQTNMLISLHFSDGPHISVNGEKLLAELAAISAKTFVDVGANAGEWSIAFASKMSAGRGLCVEPSRAIRPKLQAAISSIKNIEVKLLECAVGDTSAVSVFWEHEDSVYSGLLRSEGYGQAQASTVQVRRLDDVLHEQGWTSVDFLKIDTEGVDFKVIRGAGRFVDDGQIEVIQFEYGANWRNAGDTLLNAVMFLDERGYTTFALKSKGLYPLDPVLLGDYFMFTNFVAVHKRALSKYSSLIRRASKILGGTTR